MGSYTIAAVVLAAGKSERMGRNKLLMEVGNYCLLDWVLDALDSSSVNEVIVVLGHHPDELEPIIERHNAKSVLNLDYEKGMASSVKAGLRHASGDAVFIVLGDQLGLKPQLLNSMASLLLSDPKALIVSPIYQGKRGHPILIRKPLFPEVQAMKEGETLRDIILRHEDVHRFVEGDAWSIMDIDTPEEFERAKRLFESGCASS
ncbi:nucleotidyltransferase family protein [Candidatus Bathyarchaeota archaeon]|nr:nucleotidyltransferase family protein [Candidatus Bathyarchaeota archaeon]MBS7631436.1 nucleotidyltransferase family protein [Candidatus Bathyarchaeota archaeon]